MKKKTQTSKALDVGIALGFRSGLEEFVADSLVQRGVSYQYEELVLRFTRPAKSSRYTPDFVLSNGIIVETKGRFLTADRQKHLLVKAQHPTLDIRFVFSYSKTKISKGSNTTYADWCIKNGFLFADKNIPDAWLEE
jgi:hypothetical protein